MQTDDPLDDVVVLNDLTRYYGHQTAIDGITVGVPVGQCFGLLGANGAGKTTTLRLIAGDLLASRGTVLINGHDVRFNVQTVGHFVYKLSLFVRQTDVKLFTFLHQIMIAGVSIWIAIVSPGCDALGSVGKMRLHIFTNPLCLPNLVHYSTRFVACKFDQRLNLCPPPFVEVSNFHSS